MLRLKKQVEENSRRQHAPTAGTTNFDILKRLSNLEKHVFGTNSMTKKKMNRDTKNFHLKFTSLHTIINVQREITFEVIAAAFSSSRGKSMLAQAEMLVVFTLVKQ